MCAEIDFTDLYSMPTASALGILLKIGQFQYDINSINVIGEYFSDDAASIEFALIELMHLGLIEPLNITGSKFEDVAITAVGHTYIAEHAKSLMKNYWDYI